MSILRERIDSRGHRNDGGEENFEGSPKRVSPLGTRVVTLGDAQDGDSDEEKTDAEQEEDAQTLHGGNLDREDQRARDDHEEYVSENVADFVSEKPYVANDATGRLVFAHSLDSGWHTSPPD